MNETLMDLRRCDYRISLDPSCPAYDYFHITYIVLLVILSITIIICTYDVAFRVNFFLFFFTGTTTNSTLK